MTNESGSRGSVPHLYLLKSESDFFAESSVDRSLSLDLPTELRTRIAESGLDVDDLLSRCFFHRFDKGSVVRAAVSGGADSLALVVLAKVAGLEVVAYNVDHQIREESSLEADMVEEQLRPLHVALLRHKVRVQPGPNLEERARQARYSVLPSDISTGHTADDQVETVLYNLVRGGGLKGLSAMELGIRHPILGIRKYETDAICASVGLIPLTDPSNRDPRIVRNRVRNEVIPLLCDVAKRDVVPIIYRTSILLRKDQEIVSDVLSQCAPSTLKELRECPPHIASMWIRAKVFEVTQLQLSWFHTQKCLEVVQGGPASTSLPLGHLLLRKSGSLKVRLPTKELVNLV